MPTSSRPQHSPPSRHCDQVTRHLSHLVTMTATLCANRSPWTRCLNLFNLPNVEFLPFLPPRGSPYHRLRHHWTESSLSPVTTTLSLPSVSGLWLLVYHQVRFSSSPHQCPATSFLYSSISPPIRATPITRARNGIVSSPVKHYTKPFFSQACPEKAPLAMVWIKRRNICEECWQIGRTLRFMTHPMNEQPVFISLDWLGTSIETTLYIIEGIEPTVLQCGIPHPVHQEPFRQRPILARAR